MKKYIIFFISIGLLLGTVLFYNIMNIEKSKEVVFAEAGYILGNSSERYYFYQDEKYTKSYDDKIVFFDTEGSKVTVGNDNFIHYDSGNIVALQESVLLDLSKIDDDPIIYYNIGANKEVKKISNRYTIKNLDTELQLQNAIWKISQSKYIILGNGITIKLNNGTEKQIEGYVEIEYSDNEIVNIYNQEISYQTISSDSYIELSDYIKINLGTKIVSKKEENKMSLEDMVINSDDNVTLIDLSGDSEENEEETNETEDENVAGNQISGGGTSTNITNNSSTSNSQSSVINQGSGTGNNQSQTNENTIDIVTPDIKYEQTEEGETGVDITKVTVEPKFKLEDMKVTSVGISGKIKITDEEDLLNKEEQVLVKIINNETGKTVYSENFDYGKLNIPIDVQVLTPNTSYTIINTATYTVADNTYTKNFLYKTFVTSKIGIAIEKNGYTDTSMGFIVDFKDSLISQVEVAILNEKGEVVNNLTHTVKNYDNQPAEVDFTELTPNTKYKLMVSKIIYNGYTQEGDGWKIHYDDCKTLKQKVKMENVNYSIDTRNSKFKLFIEEVIDKDEAIQNFTYIMYEGKLVTGQDGKEEIELVEEPVYTKETQSKEITVDVGKEENGDKIVRNKYYYFKVIANCYDNEKYVEEGSVLKGPFILNGKSFPTIKFLKTEVTSTTIIGTLQILDTKGSVVLDSNNPLRIEYTDSIESNVVYKTIKDYTGITVDDDGTINIPITLEDMLRANKSYTFSVYGTINLDDGNEPYKDILIGSTIVTTNKYETLQGAFGLASTNYGFEVDFKLKDDNSMKDSIESLSSITFLLQSGANFDDKQSYKMLTITNDTASSYAKEGTTVDNLKDLLCTNSLIIKPTDFGGEVSDYSELNYTIVATITVDGTKYKNKIPITKTEDSKNTETLTITKDNEEYSAIGMRVNLETKPIISPNKNNAIYIKDITNEMAYKTPSYNSLYNKDLDDKTIVGYELNAKIQSDPTKVGITSITYYVWDQNLKPVTDKNNNQIVRTINSSSETTYLSTNQYSTIFEVYKGTTDTLQADNESGELRRGCSYRFSYTFTYNTLEDGKVISTGNKWPEETENSEKSYMSSTVSPSKQMPNIIIYPSKSDAESMYYKYLCVDYDSALEQVTNENDKENKYAGILCYDERNAFILSSNVMINSSDYAELKIGNNIQTLSKDRIYELRVRYKLNKTSSSFEELKCAKQKFEGVVDLGTLEYKVTYNVETNPNKIMIKLVNANRYMTRIAGAKVKLDDTTLSRIYEIKEQENGFYIEVDLLEVTEINVTELINKDVNVGLELYYDNGITGFENEEGEYLTYAVLDESNNYGYLGINKNGQLDLETQSLSGDKLFDVNRLNISGKDVSLDLSRVGLDTEITYILNVTNTGFKYGKYTLIPKKVVSQSIQVSTETGSSVTVENVIIGIRINNKEEELQKVNLEAQLVKTSEMTIYNNDIFVEVCPIDSADAVADWDNRTETDRSITLSLDEENRFNFTIDGLEPAKFYKLRFKYIDSNGKLVYMYSPKYTGIKFEYTIGTVATIGIDDISIGKKFNSYTDKKITISYTVNEFTSNLYKKTKYEFYEYDEETGRYEENPTFIGTQDNELNKLLINNGEHKKTTNVTYTIEIPPSENKFIFGKKYILVITPIVEDLDGTEKPVESAEYIWTTNEFQEPKLTFTFIRQEDGNVVATTTFYDQHYVIKDGKYIVEIYEEDILKKQIEYQIKDINQKTIIENAEKNKKYTAKVIFKVDMKNNGSEKEMVTTKTLEAIIGNNGIDLGTVYKDLIGNNFKITFENSYGLKENVNSIEYQITSLGGGQLFGTMGRTIDDNGNINNSETISWIQNENLVWITLPKEVENNENINYNVHIDFFNISDDGVKTKLAEVER